MGIRRSMWIASASALTLAFAAPAFAQEQASDVDEVVVTGIRASLQQSLDTKRNADAIVDSVTAEDIGKFPSTNVAEAITIVPGVTIDRAFGQGERVSILGTDPALNRTLLNGQTVASADWFILDQPGRTFNYALLAPQIVGRVDVYKSPEARIDEGSIGGTVIVNTREPLDLKANTLSLAAGRLYNDRSEQGDFQASGLYSWHNEGRTLGIVVSAQQAKDQLRRDGLEAYGTIPANYYAGGSPDNPGANSITSGNCTGACATTLLANPNAKGLNSFGTSYFEQTRERTTYTAGIQWRPIDKLELSLDWLKIHAVYDNTNQSLFAFQGNTWNSLSRLTGLTVEDGVITSASFDNALSVFDVQYREAEMNSDSLHFKGGWTEDNWDLSVEAGTTAADGGTKRQLYGEFLNWADYTVDFTGAPGSPGTLTYGSNVLGDANQFSFDGGWGDPSHINDPGAPGWNPGWGGNIVKKPTTDAEDYAQVDLGFDLDGAIKRVQVGYKYRDHETTQQMSGVTVSIYGNPDSAAMFNPHQVAGNYLDGFGGVNSQMSTRFVIDGKALADYIANGDYLRPWQANPTPGTFNNAEFTAQNWAVEEKVNALYGQADFEYAGFRGNVGLRYVKTESDSGGYVCVNVTPTGCGTTAADWDWQVRSKSYENFLPNLNVAYDATDDIVLRFSAAKVIARPNFADMSNYFWLADSILTGGGGNPDLDPYESANFDASAEWYFAKDAILAGSVFYKDISNYVLQKTAPEVHFNQFLHANATYQISRPTNAGSASIKGFTLAYQQNYAYGFGLLANYTYADGSADNGADLPYNSRHQVNISPFYENGDFSARLTYNYRSKYFTGVDRGDQMYVRAYQGLDATAGYNITDNINLTVSAMNLLDSEYYAYANTVNLPRGVYRSGRQFMTTLNFNF
ncbi:TonB-dependent receptor [Caulobacter sp. 17J65-9]|uniref:TonB-dependent receptor n=1 Tax=Caulobacter sp. 17J65-9 TaxID=2709382 RepID=UPI0013CD6B57|nr:TonB-dependent receptor [Caulobacter sp. 17J65-9]NEX94011.1 TonB-dependent receptor [Caulobacter sp. 17J65-9]